MSWKLERLKKKYKKHFDREMKLIKDLQKAGLSEDEQLELNTYILSHPHAKAALQIETDKFEEVKDRIREIQDTD